MSKGFCTYVSYVQSTYMQSMYKMGPEVLVRWFSSEHRKRERGAKKLKGMKENG